MRILVTGAGGFVGRYVVPELARAGHAVFAMDLAFPARPKEARETACLDICDRRALKRAIVRLKPQACIHLGGISFVPSAASNPNLMLDVNIGGTWNLLEALRLSAPRCRTLVISTAQVYGPPRSARPIPESESFAPASLYAATKATADLLALAYARHFGLPALSARPNNHTGPGQSPLFVIPAFISQLRERSGGRKRATLQVGNLASRRIFMDVRDIATAYRLLIEKGRPGLAYNISAGQNRRLDEVLRQICRQLNVQPRIQIDPARFRPTDRSPILDVSRLRSHTGWKPAIRLSQTLADMIASPA